ncbi:dephospho-CoA kinase [Candidatus Curculioniphilus buchneri]|uniref:dephospho-CoA kinase n=1 Tax=Candidatus Curculioniphilus buchneri TaxID=690594 RepID=UPI00376F2CDA
MTQYIVALTGGIGSGKSTIANFFSAFGIPVIDADLIARQVVKPNSIALHIIIQNFGPEILCSDGSLNRMMLKSHVFFDMKQMIWLNNLLRPLIRQKTEQQLCSIHAPYAIWVVPLLIENNLQHRANRILVVDVTPEIQITRTLQRDTISQTLIEKILETQASRQQHLTYANDIIDNNGCREKIQDRVATLHKHYLSLAQSVNR